MSDLKNKVAVVTGASKGIGAGIAAELAASGAAVVVNYASDKAGADRVVETITSAGGKAIAVQANVASKADVERLFGTAVDAFGPVDILVNNAGIYSFAALEEVTEEHYRKIFDVNVLGLLLVTQEAVKHFNSEGGSIVNIGSIASEWVPPGAIVYSATKGAVDTITIGLAKELAPKNIRVNSVNPGGVETEGTHTAGVIGSDFEKEIVSHTLLGRMGQPKDIASVVAFFASADAGWLTGEVIEAGGGYF
ncbi:Glucose 1-dehydrogenase [Methyloligella halotolerans]|uniref:Glucose 1-dehydrogenase n=1 Tax=Methyloligella halotolerans TaxID=1177755 RepID=A0A1E2S369_9HYPH|nr:glucose 1-dehydrogenase [Methyloligella halotolerans]ODA68852.1 Glucose 1-dehydrogenase [Methyloligella halotolerans]